MWDRNYWNPGDLAGLKIRVVEGPSAVNMIRPLIPFYIAMIAVLLLVTYLPELSLWLPRIFGF